MTWFHFLVSALRVRLGWDGRHNGILRILKSLHFLWRYLLPGQVNIPSKLFSIKYYKFSTLTWKPYELRFAFLKNETATIFSLKYKILACVRFKGRFLNQHLISEQMCWLRAGGGDNMIRSRPNPAEGSTTLHPQVIIYPPSNHPTIQPPNQAK